MDQNNWILLAIAIMNAITAFFAYRTHQSQTANAASINTLERNTNSIKDALVASTAKASYAEGSMAAKSAAEQVAAALLRGQTK